MIFVMGVTMLKMDRAKATWRVKLTQAFSDNSKHATTRPLGTGLIPFGSLQRSIGESQGDGFFLSFP